MAKHTPPGKFPALRFDFNTAVNETLRDFPRLSDKIVFVDALDDDRKYGTPEAIRQSELRGPARRMAEHLKLVHEKEVSLSFNKDVYGVGAVIFHASNHHRIFSAVNADHANFASFDHELGHLLTRGGFDFTLSQPLAENAADAYAALRHLQRFGADTPVLAHASFRRAYDFVMKGDAFYLTSFTLDQIAADAKTRDVSKLSPSETLARADDYALKGAPKGPEIADLLDFFAPVRESFARHGDTAQEPLACLTHMLATTKTVPPLAQALGQKILDHLINDNTQGGPKPEKPPSPRFPQP